MRAAWLGLEMRQFDPCLVSPSLPPFYIIKFSLALIVTGIYVYTSILCYPSCAIFDFLVFKILLCYYLILMQRRTQGTLCISSCTATHTLSVPLSITCVQELDQSASQIQWCLPYLLVEDFTKIA
ncbi:hypothetical protein ACH5RR_020806 [Cinchona calisaya]|uniref:Uncharacterized protein n=1 Tax=Cinchona calisaya TaxID=153742 RepID=A0ABD2ZFI2_9GENT